MRSTQKNLYKILLQSLLLVALLTSNITPAYADTGVGRQRSCDADGNPGPLISGISADIVIDSDDLTIELDNFWCLAKAVPVYTAFRVAINYMNASCRTGSKPRGPLPTPLLDTLDILKANYNLVTLRPNLKTTCLGGLASVTAALGKLYATLAASHAVAKEVYQDASICGSDWKKANISQFDMSTPNDQQKVNEAIAIAIEKNDLDALSMKNKTYREWYYGGVEVTDNPYGFSINDVPTGASGEWDWHNSSVDLDDSDYLIYGSRPCLDPSKAKVGGTHPRQKYYLKGAQIGNFNCEKYLVNPEEKDPLYGDELSASRVSDFNQAYTCCKARSANYICIDYGGRQTFCKAGTRCDLFSDAGLLATFTAKRQDRDLICAETYSLCPYNFAVGGGSTKGDHYRDGVYKNNRWQMISHEDASKDYGCAALSEIRNDDCTFNAKAGKYRNYCQLLQHCTTVNSSNHAYQSNLGSPYFSKPCFDFKGDSRNEVSFEGGVLLGSQRHFSAPIAQCIKETMENVFYNQFGHSRCLSSAENPDSKGVCSAYQPYGDDFGPNYKKGGQVSDQSFFAKMQTALQDIVKLVLTMAVMFYGMKTLLGNGAIKKGELLMFVLKVGLVLFFATGTAWQNHFFKGVYGSASQLAEMVFKIDVSKEETQRDGCQFGEVTYDIDGEIVNSSIRPYPAGKEYLAMWDTLDCKIARYLGFGPEASVANIAMLIFASLFTGPYGLYFALSMMFFGFFLISATIRALHIFLSSTIAIIVMVYMSPIIIPTAMFQKTNNIFKAWLSNLIGFCLQPMILFAYIAIFITVMDKTLIGTATFHGDAPNKIISCKEYCADADGDKISMVNQCTEDDGECVDTSDPECDDPGNQLIDPMDNSFACLININSFGKFPGLEIIGVSIPILVNVFDGNITEKVLTLLKAALVMYVLCQFMDQIPETASYLVGGSLLSSGGSILGGAKNAMGKTIGVSAALQKRGRRGTKKVGEAALEKGGQLAKHVRNE